MANLDQLLRDARTAKLQLQSDGHMVYASAVQRLVISLVSSATLNKVLHSDLARTAIDALARLEDAEAAQALVVEQAADSLLECSVWCDSQERTDASWHNGVIDARKHHMARIRALADPSGVEALAALRAERDRINQWRETAIVERDTYSEERDDALARLAAAEAQVTALRLQLDQKDALYDSGFQAGVKLGWNLGVSGDEAGFQAATASTDHVAELKRIRAALATVTPPADTGEGA